MIIICLVFAVFIIAICAVCFIIKFCSNSSSVNIDPQYKDKGVNDTNIYHININKQQYLINKTDNKDQKLLK